MAYREREYKKEYEADIKRVDNGFIIKQDGRDSIATEPLIDIKEYLNPLEYGEEITVTISSYRYKKEDKTEG